MPRLKMSFTGHWWRRQPGKRRPIVLVLAVLLSTVLVTSLGFAAPAFAGARGGGYKDATLGFTLQLPNGWQASAPNVSGQPTQNAVVTIQQRNYPGVVLTLSVTKSPQNATTFAQKGTPTAHIGNYHAFVMDTEPSTEFPFACSRRVFLAGADYVDAQWCAPNGQTVNVGKASAQMEQVLATYQPSSASGRGLTTMATTAAHSPSSCSTLVSQSGYSNLVPGWGAQLATPYDTSSPPNSTWLATPGWDQYVPGSYICSNGSSYPYEGGKTWYFQCTELVNRFIYEQWNRAEPYLTGNAGTYMDYWNGATVNGSADSLPDVQEIYDARWGVNSEPPQPGDILVWQDTNYPGLNPPSWKYNTVGTGHVAVVAGTDANYVYVAQQNDLWASSGYQNGFMAYTLTKSANGWSVDTNNKNGVTGRLLRGWLHFTENGGPESVNNTTKWVGRLPSGALQVFKLDSTDHISYNVQSAPGAVNWSGWTQLPNPSTDSFVSDPAVGRNSDGRLFVFARAAGGNIWYNRQTTAGNATSWSGWGIFSNPSGISMVGVPAVASSSDGRLYLFVLGSDGVVHLQYQTAPNGGWLSNGYTQFGNPSGVTMVGDPSVGMSSDGRLYLFVRDSNGLIRLQYQTSPNNGPWLNSGFTQFSNPSGIVMSGDPAVALSSDGRLYMFVRNNIGTIQLQYQTSPGNGPWLSGYTQFSNPSGVTMAGDPTVIANNDGRLYMFVLDSNGVIRLQYQTSPGQGPWLSSGYTQFSNPSGVTMADNPAAGRDGLGLMHLFDLGSDAHMYWAYQQSPGGSWQGLASLGGAFSLGGGGACSVTRTGYSLIC